MSRNIYVFVSKVIGFCVCLVPFSIGLHKIKLTERRNNPFNFFFFLINIIQYDYAVCMKITPFRKKKRDMRICTT